MPRITTSLDGDVITEMESCLSETTGESLQEWFRRKVHTHLYEYKRHKEMQSEAS